MARGGAAMGASPPARSSEVQKAEQPEDSPPWVSVGFTCWVDGSPDKSSERFRAASASRKCSLTFES